MSRTKAVEKKGTLCAMSIVSSIIHHSLTLTICDTRGRGVMINYQRSPVFILSFSRARQPYCAENLYPTGHPVTPIVLRKATKYSQTRSHNCCIWQIFVTYGYLPVGGNGAHVQILTCRFPTNLWYRRYLKGELRVDIINSLGSLCNAQLLAHLSKTAVEGTRLSVGLSKTEKG